MQKIILISLFIIITASSILAQIPRSISYQGYLSDKKGVPVADGDHALSLTLYNTRTGKIFVYTTTDTVTTKGGYFTALLDSIPVSVAFDKQYWLGISIDGGSELSPRTPLTSSPYALNATGVNSIAAADNSITVTSGAGPTATIGVAAKGITTANLADLAVTDAKISSVNWSKISGAPSSFPVSGDAGGDLSGSYPNPSLKASGVSAGNYTNASISVNAKGIITSASSGNAGLNLPFAGTAASANSVFSITNTANAANISAIFGTASTTTSQVNPIGAAIFGSNTNAAVNAAAFGVLGKINSQFANSAGVFGFNGSILGGAGTAGYGFYGVAGISPIANANAAGIYGVGTGAAGSYSGYFTGGHGVFVNGDFTVTGGTKAATVSVKGGTEFRKLYCEEATEIWFTDYGSAKLTSGKAHIDLDDVFLNTVTIDEKHPMKVFIQMNGETKPVYVTKGITGFDVMETGNGASNAAFDYRIVAKRRDYEERRLEMVEIPKFPEVGK